MTKSIENYQPYEAESVTDTINHFNDDVLDGKVPTIDVLMTAHDVAEGIVETDQGQSYKDLESLDEQAAVEFKQYSSLDYWMLPKERHAENVHIVNAKSMDELTPAQTEKAAFLVGAKHAAPETHLEEIQKYAKARIELSEKIYEAKGLEQPVTTKVARERANEAAGITPESRQAEEHKNHMKKIRNDFMTDNSASIIKFLESPDRTDAKEEDYPVSKDDLAKLGISQYDVLEDMTISFVANQMIGQLNKMNEMAAGSFNQPHDNDGLVDVPKKPALQQAEGKLVATYKQNDSEKTEVEPGDNDTVDEPEVTNDAKAETKLVGTARRSKPRAIPKLIATARRSKPRELPKLVGTARRVNKRSILPEAPELYAEYDQKTSASSEAPESSEEYEQKKSARDIGRILAKRTLNVFERTGHLTGGALKASKKATADAYNKAGAATLTSMYAEREQPTAEDDKAIAERRNRRAKAATKIGAFMTAAAVAYVTVRTGSDILDGIDPAKAVPTPGIYGNQLMNNR